MIPEIWSTEKTIIFETITEPAPPHEGGGYWTREKRLTFRTEESFNRFKQLIARALNTYSDAHPELKELGDILEYGKPLQDYYSQRSDKPLAVPTGEIKNP